MKIARPSSEYAVLAALAFAVLLVGWSLIASVDLPSNVGPTACWVEDKPDGSAERLCGDVSFAPQGAHSFTDTPPNEDEPAFDCRADGNQICGPTTTVKAA